MIKPFPVFLFILSIVLFSNCRDEEKLGSGEAEVVRYGPIDQGSEHLISKIYLHQMDSFTGLLDRIKEVACIDSIPTIALKDKGNLVQLVIGRKCSLGTFCVKSRNIIRIHDEEFDGVRGYEIESLEELIVKHYTNTSSSYHSEMFSESPYGALISISYSDLSIIGLEDLLLRITETFGSLNVDAPLRVIFGRHLPPPPPPFVSVD